MTQRNRKSGWKHAKLSGHLNETCIKKLLDSNAKYSKALMIRCGFTSETIMSTSVGGLHETNVLGVLGNKTKPKTDFKIMCYSGKDVNISIKKSLSGQVYLVNADSFIKTFEKQFKKTIPSDVRRAIKLFWSATDDATSIIDKYGNKSDAKNYNLQFRHKSLNATTLEKYNENLYNAMLKWFKNNIYALTKISFAMGAVKDSNEWSKYLWYINLLGENDIDEVFCIEEICNAAVMVADTKTYYGYKNGGTTIQLPFGFVQWHKKQLQFHHSYEKISNLMKIYNNGGPI